jgi:hypothetical protein
VGSDPQDVFHYLIGLGKYMVIDTLMGVTELCAPLIPCGDKRIVDVSVPKGDNAFPFSIDGELVQDFFE